MTRTSLQLIGSCCQRGLLSKEAATEVLETRDRLIKQAMAKHASRLFGILRKTTAPATTNKAKKSIFDKFRGSGGLTPPKKGGKDATPDQAQWSDVASNLGKMMALAGLTAGATAGASGIMKSRKDKSLRKDIDASYKRMFIEHPDLKDVEEHDPGRVRRHFGVLARYAPSLAADPTVAGTWVQATSKMGQINTSDIKNLAETQNRIDDAQEDRGRIKLSPLQVGTFATKAMMG